MQLGYGFKLGNSSVLTIERAVLRAAVNIAYCNGLTGVVELVYALSALVVGKCCAVPAIGYVVGPTGIRELITVDNAAQLSANYTMEVTCSGLAPMAEGGEIKFFDADSDEVFKITAPIIMDAAGEETSDITLQLVLMAELQMIDELKNFSVEVQPSETNDNNLSETEDDIAGDDIAEETPAPTEETGESVNGDDT